MDTIRRTQEDRSLQRYVVRLRGLPYTATQEDVRLFMSGVQLSAAADCIVMSQGLNGRPTGEAYIELADEQALMLAMTRHKEVMGSRYIEVFHSSKMDKLQAQRRLEDGQSPLMDHYAG
jgi:heterogeneous nuclear ribonucleoprotein F/H